MLFKTLSASVYGIDAHLVLVEVDVGVGRIQDFNVVGLPDNAVKESRQRVQSALKNCGIDFPYGQGVTINLAPADLRKEGSAFDLPMALGLAGCQGRFFGKALDQMMFLGELSLDGSVRAVRGALSAAIAARDNGIKAVAVPESNAKEAAVVEGIEVYVEVTATGGGPDQFAGIVSVRESGRPADAAGVRAIQRGFEGRTRATGGETSTGGCVCGRPQHSVYRAAWRRKDDVGQEDTDDSARDVA